LVQVNVKANGGKINANELYLLPFHASAAPSTLPQQKF